MAGTLQGIKLGAIVGITVLVFVVPLALYVTVGGMFVLLFEKSSAPTLSEAMVLIAWYFSAGPVLAGFLAARAARAQPLLHGLIVGLMAFALQSIFFRPDIWWLLLGTGISTICFSLLGAWLWRHRIARP